MKTPTEILAENIAEVKRRAAIWETLYYALYAHTSKPIGKRLCDTVKKKLEERDIKPHSVFIGGTKAFKNLTVYFGQNNQEQVSFGYEATEVSPELVEETHKTSQAIFERWQKLTAESAEIEERAAQFDAICKQVSDGMEALRAFGLPYSVESEIRKKYNLKAY